MGGVISVADTNDEMVDHLVTAGYVQTVQVEQALRSVDRGYYYAESARRNAYRDLAWREGSLHLSAPCIYAKALECLDLQPGMSFLNLGSGTGYLSTVAGFLLGAYGRNCGVELHSQVVQYAEEKLRGFFKISPNLEAGEFCPPKFVCGNCFQLDLVGNLQSFDRIYCGAAVDAAHVDMLKSFMKINGTMVLPYEDQLLILQRTGENLFEKTFVLPVSFASMVLPTSLELSQNITVTLPKNQPLMLLEICRVITRRLLRRSAAEHCDNFQPRSLLRAELKRRHQREHSSSTAATVDSGAEVECDGDHPNCTTSETSRRLRRRMFEVRRRQSASSTENQSKPRSFFNVVDFGSSEGVDIFKFCHGNTKDRRQFSRLIKNAMQLPVGPQESSTENLHAVENPALFYEENPAPPTLKSSARNLHEDDEEPTTSYRKNSFNLETLKGTCLPPDFSNENFPSDDSDEEPTALPKNSEPIDSAASEVNCGLNNKRCRSESGYASFNDDVVERKRSSVDGSTLTIGQDTYTPKEAVTVQCGGDVVDGRTPQPTMKINASMGMDTLALGQDISNDDVIGSLYSGDVVEDFEESDDDDDDKHRRRMREGRRRDDEELGRFVDDFRRRLADLPLPETLRNFLSYGRM